MSQLEMVSIIQEFHKTKAKIDELRSILASEIKSRNHSEEALQQQILLNRSSHVAEEGGGGPVMMSRMDAIEDRIHTMEDEISSERLSIANLRAKLSALTGTLRDDAEGHLKDILTDIDNGVSLQHGAKEERKQLFEGIRKVERGLVEYKDSLQRGAERVEGLQTDKQRSVEGLSALLAEDVLRMRQEIDTNTSDLQEAVVSAREARIDAERALDEGIDTVQAKIRDIDRSWKDRLSEGLRGVHGDLRSDKDSNAACLQELREVLSAEITSRRKAAGKISSSVESTTSNAERNTCDLHVLAGEVEERFTALDANLCKVTSSFSDQIRAFKTVAKVAARTLQTEQKCLLDRVFETEQGNRRQRACMSDELKRASERQDRMEAAFYERMKALDKTMEGIVAATEARNVRLEKSLAEDTEQRQTAVRHATNLLSSTVLKVTAKIEEASVEMSYATTVEVQNRVQMISALERKVLHMMGRARAAGNRELKAIQVHIASDLRNAVATEAQTMSENRSRLGSRLRDVQKECDRKVIHSTEDMKNALSHAVSTEAHTRADAVSGLERRMREALHVRFLDRDGDVLTAPNKRSEQVRHVSAEVHCVDSRVAGALTEYCEISSGSKGVADHRRQKEREAYESLLAMNSSMMKKLSDTRSDLSQTRRDVVELRESVELFKMALRKGCVEHKKCVQDMQSKIEDLEIMKEVKVSIGDTPVSESDMKALVESNKVMRAVKELAVSWKTELQQSRDVLNAIELRGVERCSHADMEDLEVRYTLDRLVTDVIHHTAIATAEDSIRALMLSCDENFHTIGRKVANLENGMELIRREVMQVGGTGRQCADRAVASVTSYVDENVSGVRTMEVVSSTLGFIVDNIVDSDLIASIDHVFDNVQRELQLETLQHIHEVLSEPLKGLHSRQCITDAKLEEYDIAYIRKKLRDIERKCEDTRDEVETLKSDVNEDLKERILNVVAAVDRLSH